MLYNVEDNNIELKVEKVNEIIFMILLILLARQHATCAIYFDCGMGESLDRKNFKFSEMARVDAWLPCLLDLIFSFEHKADPKSDCDYKIPHSSSMCIPQSHNWHTKRSH